MKNQDKKTIRNGEFLDTVVIGGVHHNTLGVVRSLGQNKQSKVIINLILVDEDLRRNNLVSSSKYVSKKRIRTIGSYETLLNELLFLAKDGKKRTLVCCSDASAEIVMGNVDLLSPYYNCPSTAVDADELMSKDCQYRIAQECGFSIPKTLVVTKGEPYDWEIFPCMTKPEKSTMGSGKNDIHISTSKDELDKAIQNTLSERLFIQEYVSKQMEYQLIGCSLDSGNKVVIPGFTRIIRQPFNTNTGYLEYAPIGNLSYNDEAVRMFLKKIGYSGLFSLEFIRDNDGIDHFLEINLRNDGNAFCVYSAGVNLPYIWCYYATHNRLPDVPLTIEKTLYFMPEFSDAKRAIKEIGFFKWLKQFIGAKSHAVFNKRDIKPFLVGLTSHFFGKRK